MLARTRVTAACTSRHAVCRGVSIRPAQARLTRARAAQAEVAVQTATVIELEGPEAYEALVATEAACVIDHYTQWCGPCKLIAPHYAEMAASDDFAGRLTFAKIDCTKAQKFAQGLGIKALPSFYLYVDGVKVGEFVGAKKDKLREFLLAELSKASL